MNLRKHYCTQRKLKSKHRKFSQRIKKELSLSKSEAKTCQRRLELRKQREKAKEQQELLDITIRNAKRLQRPSNDILDVAKIEGRSLELNKEVVQFK